MPQNIPSTIGRDLKAGSILLITMATMNMFPYTITELS